MLPLTRLTIFQSAVLKATFPNPNSYRPYTQVGYHFFHFWKITGGYRRAYKYKHYSHHHVYHTQGALAEILGPNQRFVVKLE